MGHVTSKSQLTENVVENSIKVYVKNETMNLNNSLSESLTTASTTLVSSVDVTAKDQSAVGSITSIVNSTLDNTTMTINQNNKLTTQTKQIMNILSTTSSLQSFIQNLQNKLKSNTTNDSKLSTQMNAVSKLTNAISTQEGLASVAKKAISMFSGYTGDSIDQTQINKVKNSISESIINTTTNTIDSSNIVQQISNSMITNTTSASCVTAHNLTNNFIVSGSKLTNDNINITQTNVLNAFNTCILDITQTTSIINKMFNQSITDSDQATYNKLLSDTGLKADTTLKNSMITTDSFTIIIIVLAVCAMIGGVAYYYFTNKNNSTPDGFSQTQQVSSQDSSATDDGDGNP